MDKALRSAQTVRLIQSRGDAYTSEAGNTYYAVEKDQAMTKPEFDGSLNYDGDLLLQAAIVAGTPLLTPQDILTDDQGDIVRVVRVKNKPRDGFQWLDCDASR